MHRGGGDYRVVSKVEGNVEAKNQGEESLLSQSRLTFQSLASTFSDFHQRFHVRSARDVRGAMNHERF